MKKRKKAPHKAGKYIKYWVSCTILCILSSFLLKTNAEFYLEEYTDFILQDSSDMVAGQAKMFLNYQKNSEELNFNNNDFPENRRFFYSPFPDDKAYFSICTEVTICSYLLDEDYNIIQDGNITRVSSDSSEYTDGTGYATLYLKNNDIPEETRKEIDAYLNQHLSDFLTFVVTSGSVEDNLWIHPAEITITNAKNEEILTCTIEGAEQYGEVKNLGAFRANLDARFSDDDLSNMAKTSNDGYISNEGHFGVVSNWSLTISSDTVEKTAGKYTIISTICLDNSKVYYAVVIVCILLSVLIFGTIALILTLREHSRRKKAQYERDITNAIAHDLKSELMVIGGYAENLTSGVSEEDKIRYEKGILNETAHMNDMLNRMLAMSRSESGAYSTNLTEVNINELTDRILDRTESDSKARGLTWNKNYQDTFTVTADELLLETAIDNFIRNAVKYATKDSTVTITVDKAHFTISNEWTPIKKFILHPKKLWEPYVTGSEARTNGTGSGLGLSISANILKNFGFRYKARANEKEICFSFSKSKR